MTTDSKTVPPSPGAEDEDAREAQAAAEFGAVLAAFERAHPEAAPTAEGEAAEKSELRVGSRVKGRVVSLTEESALIDVGGRSEGVADARELRRDDGTPTVKVGQTLEWVVVSVGEQLQLARGARGRAGGKSLAAVREAREAKLPVRGRVTSVNKGGLVVQVDGVRAFCPLSQIGESRIEDAKPYVGRVLEFMVLEADDARARVVLSRRRWLVQEKEAQSKERLAALEPGQELEGKVTRLEPFGAFVDLGGVEGLVHVSEISHARIHHPREAVTVGDAVRIRVLRVEASKEGRPRVALSIRAVTADPWDTAAERFTVGARVQGVVVRLADFGAFVNLEPGIDGLVHVSQVSPRRIGHAREVLAAGQAVEAVVLAVDPERKRISLSIRQATEEAVPPSEVTSPEPTGRPRERGPARSGAGPGGGREGGGRREGGRPRGGERTRDRGRPRGGERSRPEADSRPSDRTPASDRPPEPLTTMQLAFRRAREEQAKREQK